MMGSMGNSSSNNEIKVATYNHDSSSNGHGTSGGPNNSNSDEDDVLFRLALKLSLEDQNGGLSSEDSPTYFDDGYD
eukprot:CAMPEP_0175040018 /NCGR_PEP_ID=MMETSP0052_2-20121109/987_1 /TAXON_ID=51329 ORGANISM="Polytomella parva, Strain SAG 63-3" /NCGR_SAMPLE_ID=MMETSP0052_2 /ASSEMBLY_ACC=CAM_ASM_000194 /LENGTH=75 /DNA_ID=CAMNT_0016302097 /DNA_START=111 /DNA_END=338 /DNA_ORIENTATION=+